MFSFRVFSESSFFSRTVADDGSRLLHSAGRGQLGVSAGADKTSGASHPKEFIGQVLSLTSCSHTLTQKCSPLSEPEACFIYINSSDWTVYFSCCRYAAAGWSSYFLVYFPSSLLKLHHIELRQTDSSPHLVWNLFEVENNCAAVFPKVVPFSTSTCRCWATKMRRSTPGKASCRTFTVWVCMCGRRVGSKEVFWILQETKNLIVKFKHWILHVGINIPVNV